MTNARAAYEERCALLDLSDHVDPLEVSGPDAADYLQRTISADLRRASTSQGVPATLLTHKGRMVAAFEVYPRTGGFLIVAESRGAGPLLDALEKFIILEEVQLRGGDELGELLSLQGARATPILAAALSAPAVADAPPHTFLVFSWEGAELWAARRARCRFGGWDLLVPTSRRDAVLARLESAGALPIPWETAEPFRIEAGIPLFGVDATSDHMPPEAGYDDAISYDKGCYAGQEVVARIRTYGHVNRKLCRILVEGAPVPTPGAAVLAEDGAQLGTVTSACRSPFADTVVALAYVRLKGGEPGTPVTIASGGAPLTGRVAALRPDATDSPR